MTRAESDAIAAIAGEAAVVWIGGEWRTAVIDGRCVFSIDNRCTLHGSTQYPEFAA